MKKTSLILLAALCSVMLAQAAITPASFTKIDNPVKDGSLPDAMSEGTMIYGDYNNDGLLDIFAVGGQGNYYVALLKNNGAGQWENQTLGADMTGVKASAAVWIDYNNDGNLDLIYTGTNGSTNLMMAFKNKGAASGYTFEKDAACSFYGAKMDNNSMQGLTVLDANNDGWMDVAVVGSPNWDDVSAWRYTYLYLNNKGVFSPTNVVKTFAQVNGGNIYAFDYNGDGLMDLGYNGYNDNAGYINKVYTNKGNGSFEEFTGVSFVPSQAAALIAIDANQDGYQDFVQLCRNTNNSWNSYGAISTFDGTNYTTNASCGLTGGDAVASIGDVNNDGYMDIVYVGWPSQKIAYGNGDGTFTEADLTDDFASRGGFVNFVDLNGDNVLDLHVGGYNDGKGGYRNVMALNTTTSLTNAAPAAPTNLKLTATANGSTLTWDAPTQADDHTPTAALRYNIVATNADGSKVFAINPADLTTGKQKVAGGYIAYLNARTYTFTSKEFTKFYIQTIDGANVGSAFTSVEYLTIAVAVDSKDKGSVADTAILAAPGSATALPKATPKIGYEFVNWTATDGITITDATLAEGATISATKAGTVTANFQETVTYGVTVNAGKGVASVTGDKSGQITLPFSSNISATMQTGYDFLNWTASPAENAAFDNAESASTSVTVSNGSVDVTANGQAHPYALTYDNLQGATHTNPATYTIEDSITFAPACDRTNYKFKSWSPATITKGNTGEKTITASWSEYAPNGAILGEFNSWSHVSHQLVEGSVTISITEAKGYWFKVLYGVDGYRNNLDINRYNCTNLELSSSSSSDCYLRADVVGDYTFTFDTATKQLSVTFPEVATRTVYLDLSSFTGWESNAKFVVYDKAGEVALTKVSNNANCHIYSAVVCDVDSYQFKRLWDGYEYQQWGSATLALTDGNNTCKIVGWNDPDAGVATVYAPLNDTVDNVSLISGLNGKSVAAHILRAFPDTSYFYTLCLPFDLSNDQLKAFFGENYKLCYLESATIDNAGTTINMNFADRTELVAGTPYLFKPSQAVEAGWTLDVTIDATINNAVTAGATMYGLYATSVTTPNAFYLQSDKYLHPYSATTIAAAFRAYFTFGQALGVAPRAVFNFVNTPTGINDVNANVNVNQKMIIGGQLIIIRDGVKYNAQGAVIR